MKRVIRSNKLVTLLLLFWSHKCDFGAEPRSRIIATSAVKGLIDLFSVTCVYEFTVWPWPLTFSSTTTLRKDALPIFLSLFKDWLKNMHLLKKNKMVTYNAHFHARRAQCADPWTAKRLQTLKQLQETWFKTETRLNIAKNNTNTKLMQQLHDLKCVHHTFLCWFLGQWECGYLKRSEVVCVGCMDWVVETCMQESGQWRSCNRD
jgi:hypothetical protein